MSLLEPAHLKLYNYDNYFEKVHTQLEGLHNEIGSLSKKSQNDALNKFKLKFVNQALSDANKILGSAYKPFNDFEQFNEDDMPSNSDVTMMLGQYLNCMEKLRSDNITIRSGRWFWFLDKNKETEIRTAPPKKINE